jgi:hypothetical protein
MHTRFRRTFLLLAALGFGLSAPMAAASTEPVYVMQMPAKGLRSPLIAPTLGPFAIASRVVGSDFQLTAPTSNSAGAFSYTSSDPSVASITGDWVTVLKAGTTIVTARQAATATHDSASTTASFTVKAPLPSGYVESGSLTWVRPTDRLNHADAVNYCSTRTFNGSTGWRLPNLTELEGLTANATQLGLASKGWPMTMSQPYGLLRSSTPTLNNPGYHMGCRLSLGTCNISQPDSNAAYEAYVTCVK